MQCFPARCISQDAGLERRITSLISSGEEDTSYTEAYDTLKKQLNRRRFNKSGQLPALEAELAEVRQQITAAGQTVRLDISSDGAYSEKQVDIHAPEGQTVTVFETLRAEKGLLVRTALHVEKDAKVRLVQIQNAAQDSLLRLETSGECAENGQVELIQILLGRGDVYSDGHFELNGDGAGFNADIGYLGQNSRTIDINLAVNHHGQKTTSEISAAGALKDDAKKIFRGTIDSHSPLVSRRRSESCAAF